MTPRPILLLEIPMETQKNSSENYRQFGHSVSEMFASPGIGFRLLVTCKELCLSTKEHLHHFYVFHKIYDCNLLSEPNK
jgi:hypothetical protein